MKERSVSILNTIRRELIQLSPKLIVFAEIVDAGSITQAAKNLGSSKSKISKSLTSLEDKLDVLLIERTTRVQTLTNAGEQLYHSLDKMLLEGEMALAGIVDWKKTPAGNLRITMAELASKTIATALTEFKKNYPRVNIEVIIDDASLDLAQNHFDLGIRFGWHEAQDQNLIVRQLKTQPLIMITSPAYLKQAIEILTPDDLSNQDWVVHQSDPIVRNGLLLNNDGSEITVQLKDTMSSNSAMFIKEAVIAGMGIAMFPKDNIREELEVGRLVQLLPEWEVLILPNIYIVYTHRNALTSIARLFIDQLQKQFA